MLWLALVNTALGYWIYNRTLIKLSALEMNMIMNLTPFFTAILSWITLGESLAGIQYPSLAIMVIGVAFVQFGKPDPHPLQQVEGSLYNDPE